MKKNTLLILSVLLAPMLHAQNISSFSPTSGLTGTTLSILGTGFNATPASNTVRFNGQTATVTLATTTALTVTVPAGASSGAVTVQVGTQTATASSIFTVLATSTCNGISNNNAKHWYFGNQAAVSFESDGPLSLTDSAMNQVEGVATMSDANGQLLFYTNGIEIYNRNHQLMQNGSGLLSHSSNTQAAFVVPFPGNPNQYFVVTPGPYYYSIVDMTLDNGNGGVLPTAKNILITNENSEKVAGLLAANQTDIWLVTYGNNNFNSYLITTAGISSTPVTSAFDTASGFFGYMKISPDQTKLVTANFDNNFHLFDFNATTGVVSNKRVVNFPFGGHGTYGIEFSPNSNIVYAADHRGSHTVRQFDITQPTPELIAASEFTLAVNPQALGALQLGPDNKIYVARENSPFLGVIEQPNVLGAGCQYVIDGVSLSPKTSNLGLPGFVASALVKTEPYISGFSPAEGPVGTEVTLTGLNFNDNPANHAVTFNGVPAVVTAASETSLTVIVPELATTGVVSVAVGCGLVASADVFTVTVLGTTAFETALFSVHPNPSTGIFELQFKQPIAQADIQVMDLNGRLVHQEQTGVNTQQKLDLNRLQSGIYLLKVATSNATYTQKIIKK